MLLTACAPAVNVEDTGAHLEEFELQPVPREQRFIIAVPSFTVGAGSVRIGSVDLSREGEEVAPVGHPGAATDGVDRHEHARGPDHAREHQPARGKLRQHIAPHDGETGEQQLHDRQRDVDERGGRGDAGLRIEDGEA